MFELAQVFGVNDVEQTVDAFFKFGRAYTEHAFTARPHLRKAVAAGGGAFELEQHPRHHVLEGMEVNFVFRESRREGCGSLRGGLVVNQDEMRRGASEFVFQWKKAQRHRAGVCRRDKLRWGSENEGFAQRRICFVARRENEVEKCTHIFGAAASGDVVVRLVGPADAPVAAHDGGTFGGASKHRLQSVRDLGFSALQRSRLDHADVGPIFGGSVGGEHMKAAGEFDPAFSANARKPFAMHSECAGGRVCGENLRITSQPNRRFQVLQCRAQTSVGSESRWGRAQCGHGMAAESERYNCDLRPLRPLGFPVLRHAASGLR